MRREGTTRDETKHDMNFFLSDLKLISPSHAYKLDDIAGVEDELSRVIIPAIVGQTPGNRPSRVQSSVE